MKIIKIITHPITVVICFLSLLISGEHLGGFYLLYILLGLTHGAIHSILAIVGVIIIVFTNLKYKREFNYLIEPLMNITGSVLLVLSLFFFFYNDKNHYNYATFYQTIPLIVIGLFIIVCLSFLIANLSKIKFKEVAI